MKETFNSEEEALAYKEEHQLFGRQPEPLKGTKKWGLVFPLECHVTVLQPHENDPGCHPSGQPVKKPAKGKAPLGM